MCYGNPQKSIELARATMTQEEWWRFEADFEHFKSHNGCEIGIVSVNEQAWARWAALYVWRQTHHKPTEKT